MALATAFASIASSIGGAYARSASASVQANAQNQENRAQYAMNKEITARALGTLGYRTDRVASDINRNRVARNIQIKRAAMVATGEQVTEAARIGSAGKRPDVNRRQIGRTAANAISDANINAQTQLDNLTITMQDIAYSMIDQLRAAVPQRITGPSTMSSILSAASAGLDAYSGLTDIEKAEISNLFPTKGPTVIPNITHIGTPATVVSTPGFGR